MRYSTTNTNIKINFCFLFLLLVLFKINLAKSSSEVKSNHLKTNLGSKQINVRLYTELFAADIEAKTDNKVMYTISYYKAGVCTENNCRNPYGKCDNENLCTCNVGYVQLSNISTGIDEPSCATRLKSQAIFFALEFLTWIGIGHFYAGRIAYGFVKLSVFIFIIALDVIIKRCLFPRVIPAKNKNSFVMISYGLYASFVLWQTIDIIFIGSNLFRDGNGLDIMTWEK